MAKTDHELRQDHLDSIRAGGASVLAGIDRYPDEPEQKFRLDLYDPKTSEHLYIVEVIGRRAPQDDPNE